MIGFVWVDWLTVGPIIGGFILGQTSVQSFLLNGPLIADSPGSQPLGALIQLLRGYTPLGLILGLEPRVSVSLLTSFVVH